MPRARAHIIYKGMRFLKKLDLYTLRNFLVLFCGTFVICLFLVMMQFLWKYVDDLVGKGLSMDVLAKFFFYAGETLVSLALPLAILLASLISFGNMGERLELLAIKAAGISLWRMMRPLIFLMIILTAISFHFQDVIAPKAQNRLMSLLYSIRQKSPELDIPEGVFYDGVQGMNLFVKHKDMDTGMLYGVVIYNMRDGVNNAHIILADSGRMETSADKQCLLLHLWSGEQFENLRTNALATNNVPYRRETFVRKLFLIDFDQNFEMQDADFSTSARTKDIDQLQAGVDSLAYVIDSTAQMFYQDMQNSVLRLPAQARKPQSEGKETQEEADNGKESKRKSASSRSKKQTAVTIILPDSASVDLDSTYARLPLDKQLAVKQKAAQKLNTAVSDLEFRVRVMKEYHKDLRSHEIQIWQKVTLSLACLVFFFIGAPLGAIIRKGGLGLPVVVAVLIFIFYYIVNSFGENLAQAGTIPVWFGLWFSTAVLTPIGAFLTIKSNNDSVVFSMDSYRLFFHRLLGLKAKRHITRKEVIINDPDYPDIAIRWDNLITDIHSYLASHATTSLHDYVDLVRGQRDPMVTDIVIRMESLVDELSNSRSKELLAALNDLPVIESHWKARLNLKHCLCQAAESGIKIAAICRDLTDQKMK